MKSRLSHLLVLVAFSAISLHAAEIPEAAISELYSRAKKSPGDKPARIEFYQKLIADGQKLLADNPEVKPADASRDILVRRVLLRAAENLYQVDPTPANRETLIGFAKEVATSSIYEAHNIEVEKPAAAQTLAKLEIYSTSDAKPEEAAKHIRAMVDMFPIRPELKNPEALRGQALVYAVQLARKAGETALVEEYAKEIAAKHVAAKMAIDTLNSVGKPVIFESELTTLDGKKISFPKDTLGKVVVLDFWATWCGPCRASLPHVRELHEKYKDRDVLVIGVSCDSPQSGETSETNKKKVADLIAKDNLNWTQTYSGEWPAPAVKYGVSSIPKVFVLDREGRILSSEARGREESLIEEALAAKPAAK